MSLVTNFVSCIEMPFYTVVQCNFSGLWYHWSCTIKHGVEKLDEIQATLEGMPTSLNRIAGKWLHCTTPQCYYSKTKFLLQVCVHSSYTINLGHFLMQMNMRVLLLLLTEFHKKHTGTFLYYTDVLSQNTATTTTAPITQTTDPPSTEPATIEMPFYTVVQCNFSGLWYHWSCTIKHDLYARIRSFCKRS